MNPVHLAQLLRAVARLLAAAAAAPSERDHRWIWITIAQGLANHVDQKAEALRSQFVNHEGNRVVELVVFIGKLPLPGELPCFAAMFSKFCLVTPPGRVAA